MNLIAIWPCFSLFYIISHIYFEHAISLTNALILYYQVGRETHFLFKTRSFLMLRITIRR